jgi:hypothetical protein
MAKGYFSKNPNDLLVKKCYPHWLLGRFGIPSVGMMSFLVAALLLAQQLCAQTNYYYKGAGNLNNLSSWGVNTDGGGAAPADFTSNAQTFIIVNTPAITHASGLWAVGGTGSRIVMGNPTTATPGTPSPAITITIAAGSQITSGGNNNFDVSVPSTGTHKIIYQNTSAISFQVLTDPNLELVFDGCTLSTSTSRTFGHVSLINGANIDMGGTSAVFGSLTVNEGCTLSGPIGSSSQYVAIKSGGSVVINGTFRAGRQGSVNAPAVGGLYTTGVAIPVVASNANATLLFQDAATTPALTLGSNSTIDYYRGASGQTGIQGITPWAYANLTLSNASAASNKSFGVPGNITVSGRLLINLLGSATITQPSGSTNLTILPTGNLVVNSATALPTNGRLTLKSDANSTAAVGTLVAGASITGAVLVERFIPGGFRRNRFLSHPFSAAQPLSILTGKIDITGNPVGTVGQGGQTTGDGFTATATNNPSAFFFSTADANGNATDDGGWKPFVSASTASWGVGQGLRALVRGTKGQSGTLDGTEATPEAVTLEMTGNINTGNVSVPLVVGGSGTTAGYNLVGNPYASPVDIGAVLTAAGANVGNAFYLRNPQTGAYITVSPIPASYMIPAGTAFFVKANTATNLNFTEANKSTCVGCATVFRAPGENPEIDFQIFGGGLLLDRLTIGLSDAFSNALDAFDAEKLMNEGLNWYAISTDQHRLAASYFNSSVTTIPLGVSLPKALGRQSVTVSVSMARMAPGSRLLLHDKATNTFTELQNGTTFSLGIDPNDASQVGENRLAIVIKKA